MQRTALTLKQGGNLLLLDEPTNDLDVETLSGSRTRFSIPGCAVVITHDRWFLDRIATHILAYEGTDEDPANWYRFEGNFEAYEENKVERLGPDAASRTARPTASSRATDPATKPMLHVPIGLRWSDLDAYGHVNNAAMLRLLEEARIQAFWVSDHAEAVGGTTAALTVAPVPNRIARQEIEYLAQIPYLRQPLDVQLWLGRLGGAKVEVATKYGRRARAIPAAHPVLARGDHDRARRRIHRTPPPHQAPQAEVRADPLPRRAGPVRQTRLTRPLRGHVRRR